MNRARISIGVITVVGWLLFFAFPLLLVSDRQESELSLLASPQYWQFCLIYFLVFYLNAKLLTPYLLLQKKYGLYGLSVLLLLGGVYALRPFDDLLSHSRSLGYIAIPPEPFLGDSPPRGEDRARGDRPMPLPERRPSGPGDADRPFPTQDITSLFIFAVVLTLSTATEATQRWQINERRAAKAEAGRARAELSFLKAQINPHFLFNTLNNIYTLAVTGNEKTADSIMKLSNIMRFVTDDVREEQIPLQQEVDCIEDYVDLQKLRLGKSADITFEVTGKIAQQSISPMILLTFVENAFKHGISKRAASPVVINLDASPDRIYFYCQNQYFEHQSVWERDGIGIDNTKQRLQHLYPSNHRLTIDRTEKTFTVILEINTI